MDFFYGLRLFARSNKLFHFIEHSVRIEVIGNSYFLFIGIRNKLSAVSNNNNN